MKENIQELKNKINDLEGQLKEYIPRRRVRRVYKQLRKILEQDKDVNIHIDILKNFINKIEKDGNAIGDQKVKSAIEYLLSDYEVK